MEAVCISSGLEVGMKLYREWGNPDNILLLPFKYKLTGKSKD
jgi:hypothetical protein